MKLILVAPGLPSASWADVCASWATLRLLHPTWVQGQEPPLQNTESVIYLFIYDYIFMCLFYFILFGSLFFESQSCLLTTGILGMLRVLVWLTRVLGTSLRVLGTSLRVLGTPLPLTASLEFYKENTGKMYYVVSLYFIFYYNELVIPSIFHFHFSVLSFGHKF